METTMTLESSANELAKLLDLIFSHFNEKGTPMRTGNIRFRPSIL
jgi:hypothetical protein